jgi:hypothetical protein
MFLSAATAPGHGRGGLSELGEKRKKKKKRKKRSDSWKDQSFFLTCSSRLCGSEQVLLFEGTALFDFGLLSALGGSSNLFFFLLLLVFDLLLCVFSVGLCNVVGGGISLGRQLSAHSSQ